MFLIRNGQRRVTSFVTFNLLAKNMSQKTITSFFKRTDTSPQAKKPDTNVSPAKSSGSSVENSPLKKPSHQPKLLDSPAGKRKLLKTETDLPKRAKPLAEKVSYPESKSAVPSTGAFSSTKQAVVFGDAPVALLDYTPEQANYKPVEHAAWLKGQPVPYFCLAKTLDIIEGTSGRLRITEILVNFYRSVLALSPEQLKFAVYLSLNELAPAYEGVELGIADQTIIKSLAESTGRTLDKVKAEYQEKGDLGLVAISSKTNQRLLVQPAPLTLETVFQKLLNIAKCSGAASQSKKVNMIKGLIVAGKPISAKFIIRSLSGKLRIGLAEKSVLTALAQAAILHEIGVKKSTKEKMDEAELSVKTAFCECPNFDKLIPAMLEHGVLNLSSFCTIQAGVPIKPMLAHPTKGVSEVLSRFDKAELTLEYKYDGERAQIHLLESGKVHIFSRNSEDNTSKYPDLTDRILESVAGKVTTAIIDSEVVAVEGEKILPFQVLTTRKRKDADVNDLKVDVCIFAFDLLYLNGESLVKHSLRERRKLLLDTFNVVDGKLRFATGLDCNDPDTIQEFLETSIKENCEGLMVKTLDSNACYEIAKRSRSWLKLKKDYLEGVGDTLDLVVLGAYKGTGRRTGKYGGFLLACYNQDDEEYQSICKIGTGFSDEDLDTFFTSLETHKIATLPNYYIVNDKLRPDVWFAPKVVWEVKAADLSLSPVHTAARGLADPERGISLRFPRFIRIRDDKNAEDATSAQQVKSMYSSQQQMMSKSGGNNAEEDDFY